MLILVQINRNYYIFQPREKWASSLTFATFCVAFVGFQSIFVQRSALARTYSTDYENKSVLYLCLGEPEILIELTCLFTAFNTG